MENKVIDIKTKKAPGKEAPSIGMRDKLEKRLIAMQANMEKGNTLLKNAMKRIEEMQMNAARLEEQYTKVLLDYADRIGHENVAIKYLDYCPNVEYIIDTDGKVTLAIKGVKFKNKHEEFCISGNELAEGDLEDF